MERLRERSGRAPIVVKVGGAVLEDLDSFWPQVEMLSSMGPVAIVHGGGREASALAAKLGHRPRIIRGRRVTTALDLQIVEWTMRGAINVSLVGQALTHGLRGVGLCGADGGLLMVTRREPWTIDGEEVDFGWVGEISSVHPRILTVLIGAGYLPIIAPVGIDDQGRRYNVNADTVASALAVALAAESLILVTDTGGIRRHANDASTLVRSLSARAFSEGQAQGWIVGGMQVKGHVAVEALRKGVRQVFVTGPDDLIKRSQATQIVL